MSESAFRYDYSCVGGRMADFLIREGVPMDRRVITEVMGYACLPVEGKHVLDIGANIGAYTVLAGQLGAHSVTAVEAHPDNARLAEANIVRNHVEATCIHGAAISGGPYPDVTLYEKGNSHGMHSLCVRGGTPIRVPTVAWDSLFPADVIKLDCEGSEYDLLLRGGIPDCVSGAVVELHLGRKAWRRRGAPAIIKLFEGWHCLIEPKIGPKNWVTLGAWVRS